MNYNVTWPWWTSFVGARWYLFLGGNWCPSLGTIHCTFLPHLWWIFVSGVKESSRFQTSMTISNLSVLGFVLLAGLGTEIVHAENFPTWHGWNGTWRRIGVICLIWDSIPGGVSLRRSQESRMKHYHWYHWFFCRFHVHVPKPTVTFRLSTLTIGLVVVALRALRWNVHKDDHRSIRYNSGKRHDDHGHACRWSRLGCCGVVATNSGDAAALKIVWHELRSVRCNPSIWFTLHADLSPSTQLDQVNVACHVEIDI